MLLYLSETTDRWLPHLLHAVSLSGSPIFIPSLSSLSPVMCPPALCGLLLSNSLSSVPSIFPVGSTA